jgi:hypothetical protein
MTNTEIQKTTILSEISVDSLDSLKYQKEGTLTAQLRQVVTTTTKYPSRKLVHEMQDNPFADQFDVPPNEWVNEKSRVAWINVPVGISLEEVTEKVKNGKLVQTTSNSPILTEGQKYAIDNGKKTMDDFAKSQIIQTKNEDGVLEVVKDKEGKFQYKVYNFKMDKSTPDVDLRGTTEEYIPSWINEEIQELGGM